LARTAADIVLLALQNKKVLYDLLFRASAETLLEVARDPRHLGAEIGFFSVLHTWSQKLGLHPHVHCVIPAGGLSLDHARWIASRQRFFLPIHVLRRVFRGKGLRRSCMSVSFRTVLCNYPIGVLMWWKCLELDVCYATTFTLSPSMRRPVTVKVHLFLPDRDCLP
jgi:hypothetical protein